MYAQLLLPLAIDNTYTYCIDSELLSEKLEVGRFVAAPIGKKRVVGAIITELSEDAPSLKKEPRKILASLYNKPIITPIQLQFWEWLSSYYMLPIGTMAYSFLPPSLKPSYSYSEEELSSMKFEFDSVFGFKEREYILFNEKFRSFEAIEELLQIYNRAKRKRELIIELCEEIAVCGDFSHAFLRSDLQAKGYGGVVNELLKQEVLIKDSKKEEINYSLTSYNSKIEKNSPQNELLSFIESDLSKGKTILVESQKENECNEALIRLIDDILEEKGEVLFLTPIVSNSNRHIKLFEKHFSENLIVYDKKKSKNRQHELYSTILDNTNGAIVVASRMGVGLPFKNLKLVVVDREHDSLYLGSEHDLNFNGRDAAVYLSFLHRANCILLSSSPSIESIYNCQIGKYSLISSKNNFLSKISTIERSAIAPSERKFYDNSSERRFLSKLIISEIEKRSARGEITLLYQNRKGFATLLECGDCGEYQLCRNCNTTLAYYKSTGELRCRYCGSSYSRNTNCSACGSSNLKEHGIGTENVEERIKELFPLLRIIRIDADTLSSVTQFKKAMEAIENREVDIIIATQIMFSMPKPENITLVGVINGDNLFVTSDYKSNERAFQVATSLRMMLRDDKESLMVLQMSQHENFVKNFTHNNLYSLYKGEINDRENFNFPPFCKIITFRADNPDIESLEKSCNEFIAALRFSLNSKVSDLVVPMVDKIRGRYIREVVIKCRADQGYSHAKKVSKELASKILKKNRWKAIVL